MRYEDPALGIYKKLLLKDNRLRGVILVGDIADEHRYMDWLRSGTDLRRTAAICCSRRATADPGLEVAAMPDSETICGCNGVTQGRHHPGDSRERHHHAGAAEGMHARLHQLRKLHRHSASSCCAPWRRIFRKRPEPRSAPACRSPTSSCATSCAASS